MTFQYQWYWNVTWRQWRQHLDPLCTHGHLNFQNYYIMHAPTMTCDIRIEPPPPPPHKKPLGTCCFTPTSHKKPSELVVIPPLLTKTPRNLLLCTPTPHKKPLGTCCYTPTPHENPSELVVIPPPPPNKKTPELVVYMFSRLLSFTKGIRCHHLSHTDVIFLWRLSGGFYQNYRCFYDTVFLCMCICI